MTEQKEDVRGRDDRRTLYVIMTKWPKHGDVIMTHSWSKEEILKAFDEYLEKWKLLDYGRVDVQEAPYTMEKWDINVTQVTREHVKRW